MKTHDDDVNEQVGKTGFNELCRGSRPHAHALANRLMGINNEFTVVRPLCLIIRHSDNTWHTFNQFAKADRESAKIRQEWLRCRGKSVATRLTYLPDAPKMVGDDVYNLWQGRKAEHNEHLTDGKGDTSSVQSFNKTKKETK